MGHAGYLDIDDRIYHFESASCLFDLRGISVWADAPSLSMKLCALPIVRPDDTGRPVFEEYIRVKGAPNRSPKLFTMSEVVIDLRRWLGGVRLIRAACRGHNAAGKTLTVDFEMILRDVERGGRYHAEGMVTGEFIEDYHGTTDNR
jgi:hypothetical protein